MKLARFTVDGGPVQIGAVEGAQVASISAAAPALAPDMPDLIADWPERAAALRQVLPAAPRFATDAVQFLAPVRRPGKIMAIGLNYADHIAETGMAAPADQVWFIKAGTAVNGPFDRIELPGESPHVDYEAEMVAVIGAGGRNIARDSARSRVFGWCAGNDVTERAWQHRTPQWSLGKSFDTHAPFGPWITTDDEIDDPHALGVRSFVNGQPRQSSNTRHLVFNVWDQIAHLSQAMTLEPGDLLFTGTPSGVGAAMKPMQFLQPGDVVRVEIDVLGAIENVCR